MEGGGGGGAGEGRPPSLQLSLTSKAVQRQNTPYDYHVTLLAHSRQGPCSPRFTPLVLPLDWPLPPLIPRQLTRRPRQHLPCHPSSPNARFSSPRCRRLLLPAPPNRNRLVPPLRAPPPSSSPSGRTRSPPLAPTSLVAQASPSFPSHFSVFALPATSPSTLPPLPLDPPSSHHALRSQAQ